MLTELSVVEQRYLAVSEALHTGATITDIARRYGVDRRTIHRAASLGTRGLPGCDDGQTP